jgi:hypothetical protein
MTRAACGHDVMAMTKMTVKKDGPSRVASTMASGRNGITRNQSVSRINTVSRQAP